MQAFLVFITLGLVASAMCQVIPGGAVERVEQRDDSGNYELKFTTRDGQVRTETGILKPNADGTGEFLEKKGTVAYTSPEGIVVWSSWIADQHGNRVIGSHVNA